MCVCVYIYKEIWDRLSVFGAGQDQKRGRLGKKAIILIDELTGSKQPKSDEKVDMEITVHEIYRMHSFWNAWQWKWRCGVQC